MRLPIKLGDRQYAADLRGYQRQTLSQIRQQADSSAEPGESTLSPLDLWRRSASSWAGGTGQEAFDLQNVETQRDRFRSSEGVDPWERGELSLLHDVETRASSVDVEVVHLVVVDGHLCRNGNAAGNPTVRFYPPDGIPFSIDVPNDNTVRALASDGTFIYIATVDGVYSRSPTVAGWVQESDQTADNVAFVAGRLMSSHNRTLYNIVSDTETTTVGEAPIVDWKWTCFTETPTHILVGGGVDDAGAVYRITIRSDGTALSAPSVAAELPAGETMLSILGYVGIVVLGTNRGLRMAYEQDGFLSYGPLLDVGPVHSLHAFGRYIWYGLDGGQVGRIDPSRNNAPGGSAPQPAYADDIATGDDGPVTGLTTFDNATWDGLWVGVGGGGLYNDVGVLVESGTLDTGWITYNLASAKVYDRLDLHMETADGGSIEATVHTRDGTSVGPLVWTESGEKPLDPTITARAVRIVFELKRATDGSSPKLRHWTLKAAPIIPPTKMLEVPLILEESVVDDAGNSWEYDVRSEVEYLEGLEKAGEPVTYEEFGTEMQVYIEGIQAGNQEGLRLTADGSYLQGIYTVQLKRVTS